MILTKEVEVKPTGRMINYYKDKGYNAKWRESLLVNIEDLPKGSDVKVDVLCDMCNKNIMKVVYDAYNKTIEKTGNYVCRECSFQKKQQTTLKKYGVLYASQSEDIKEKIKKTNLDRYGVENPRLNLEIQEKIKQTNLKKYGVENVFSNKEIRRKRDETLIEKYGTPHPLQNQKCLEKIKQTNMDRYGVEFISQLEEVKNKFKQTSIEKYGVDNPAKNKEVKEKIKKTNLERYGVESILSLPSFHEHSREVNMEKYGVYHHLQNPEILAKQKETFYKNGTCATSNQQIYLHNLYGGELNYPIKHYNADICFLDEKLVIEYDGSGHDLSVKKGNLTKKEFNQKEIVRNSVLKYEGYQQMRIISSHDKLPSDQILLQMLEITRNYFSTYSTHSWIEFDIDSSFIRSSEYKDGVFFNYGKLRITKNVT